MSLDDTTVNLPAYVDPLVLAWEMRPTYHVRYPKNGSGPAWAFGSVTEYPYHPESVPGFTWLAVCSIAGIGTKEFRRWCATAEDGREAVEAHIASNPPEAAFR